MTSRDRRAERKLHAAQRRAASRRSGFDSVVRGEDIAPSSSGFTSDPSAPAIVPFWERLGVSLFLSLLLAVTVCVSVLYGFPVLGQPWHPAVIMLTGALAIVLLYILIPRFIAGDSLRRLLIGLFALALPFLLVLGLSSQVVINGKAYLRNSVTAESYSMAMSIRDDLLNLERQQGLLRLAPAEAQGLAGEYENASLVDAETAQRWNPALYQTLPLPGFAEVLRLTNAAASAQATALTDYKSNLIVLDPSRAVDIDRKAAEAEKYYTDAARVLGETVAPLGISLVGGA